MAVGPISSNTSTGAVTPLTGIGPSGTTWTNPSARRSVSPVSRVEPGRRELLHARGQMRGLADRRVVHAEIAADGAHDHLAGVESDADLDLDTVLPAQLGGVAGDRLLHGEGGVAGADGVVLVGERRAEERHDAVAHDLVHGALVAVHRVHHALEDRVQELARVLGIAVGEQLEGALHVGEHHGDMLALSLERVAGGQNLLGQVPRCVDLEARRAKPWRRARRQGLAALVAEATAGQRWCARSGTDHVEATTAAAAELGAVGIVLPTLAAVHVSASAVDVGGRLRSRATATRYEPSLTSMISSAIAPGGPRGEPPPPLPCSAPGPDRTPCRCPRRTSTGCSSLRTCLAPRGPSCGSAAHLGGETIDLVVDIHIEGHGRALLPRH